MINSSRLTSLIRAHIKERQCFSKGMPNPVTSWAFHFHPAAPHGCLEKKPPAHKFCTARPPTVYACVGWGTRASFQRQNAKIWPPVWLPPIAGWLPGPLISKDPSDIPVWCVRGHSHWQRFHHWSFQVGLMVASRCSVPTAIDNCIRQLSLSNPNVSHLISMHEFCSTLSHCHQLLFIMPPEIANSHRKRITCCKCLLKSLILTLWGRHCKASCNRERQGVIGQAVHHH